MEKEKLKQAIVQSSTKVKLNLEPDLTKDEVIDTKDTHNQLSLLQSDFSELWQEKANDGSNLIAYAQTSEAEKPLESVEKNKEQLIDNFIQKSTNDNFIIFRNPLHSEPSEDCVALAYANRLSNSNKDTQLETYEFDNSEHSRKTGIKYLGLLLIIFIIGAATGGYHVAKEILLNIDNDLVLNCVEKTHCSKRIEAVENLVKARKSLESYNFYNADFRNADLHHANFNNANFYNADLRYTDLRYANLLSADLRYTNLYNTDLRYTDLRYADLRYAKLHNADLRYIDFRYTDLRSAKIHNTDLRYTDLRYTDLRYTNLENANLRYTNLENADLRHTNLANTDLRYTNLENADLRHTNLENANLIKSKSLNPSQIKTACNWEKAIYVGYYNPQIKKWTVEEEANQEYIKQLKQDRVSHPRVAIDCSQWD